MWEKRQKEYEWIGKQIGTIRFLLAFSVVSAHTAGFPFIRSDNAVQLFFLISGFLISYILVEDRAYQRISKFYLNRFLRLYPLYIFVCLFTILILYINGMHMPFVHVFNQSPEAAKILLAISNSTLLLSDSLYFVSVEGNRLGFTTNFNNSEVPLTYGLIIPPMWSIGIEIMFYLVAPFILRRRILIFLFLGLSILIRESIIFLGIGYSDPWSFRFFPTELAFFLIGAISHQFIYPFYQKIRSSSLIKLFQYIAVIGLSSVIFLYSYINIFTNPNIKFITVILCFFVLLGPLFNFQSSNKIDRFVGELSYPIYIVHWSVIWYISFFLPGFTSDTKGWKFSALVMCVSIIYSVMLVHFISKPIERIRQKIKRQN